MQGPMRSLNLDFILILAVAVAAWMFYKAARGAGEAIGNQIQIQLPH